VNLTRAGVEQLLAEHTPLAEHGRCNLCGYVSNPCAIAELCLDWLDTARFVYRRTP